jgi:competence protein ComEC
MAQAHGAHAGRQGRTGQSVAGTLPGGTSAGTWPGSAGIPAPWLTPWPAIAGPLAARLRQWAVLESAPGRLMPWVPVAFGTGVVLYFAAGSEPVWWLAAMVAAAALAVAVRLRARPVGFPAAVAAAAVAIGFAAAATKSRLVDHTILLAPAYGVSLTGFVEAREERERSDRIVVRVETMDAARLVERPERVRLTVRKGAAPDVGAFIALKARLNPPASPFRPGGYDLARDLYFQKIGAIGLALGRIEVRARRRWRRASRCGSPPPSRPSATASTSASAARCPATPGRSRRR